MILDVAAAALVVAGGLAAAAALSLVALPIAAMVRRPPAVAPTRGTARLVVLVPAHDEAELIGRCLNSFGDQDYPSRPLRGGGDRRQLR